MHPSSLTKEIGATGLSLCLMRNNYAVRRVVFSVISMTVLYQPATNVKLMLSAFLCAYQIL